MGSRRVCLCVTANLRLSFPWLFGILLLSLPFATGRSGLPGPYTIFKTEPEFTPIKIHINYYGKNRSEIEPGYTFISPHVKNRGWGPHIFDQDGELVWYGQNTTTEVRGKHVYAMNFHACDYLGEQGAHLCYSEVRPDGKDDGIRSSSANRIFTSSYEQVGEDYQIASGFTWPNPHEFHMFPGGETFVQAVYKLRKYDLRPYKGSRDGYIYEGCFQEVDVRTTDEIFRWCVLDEQAIWNTYIYLQVPENKRNLSNAMGGEGTEDAPWDFMHLNAIDKNEEGDYIVSGRHFDQVLKIAGPDNRHGLRPGKIIWKLGGKTSGIKMNPATKFTRQHHSRFVSTTANETTISVFDNAWDGETKPSAHEASAKIISINNQSKTATAVHVYKHPENKLSYAEGSLQTLPNGNVYVGWGALPEWSEFSKNGTLLSHGKAIADTKHLENYRTYKFPWVGRPNTRPKLVMYSKLCRITPGNHTASPLVAYASWNGATEVASWRVTVGSSAAGPWADSGTYPRAGFETQMYIDSLTMQRHVSLLRYAYVDALDSLGNHLGRSEVVPTFVPNPGLHVKCDAQGCMRGKRFEYAEDMSRAELCGVGWADRAHAIVALAMVCVAFEFIDYYVMQRVVRQRSERRGRRAKNLPAKLTHEM